MPLSGLFFFLLFPLSGPAFCHSLSKAPSRTKWILAAWMEVSVGPSPHLLFVLQTSAPLVPACRLGDPSSTSLAGQRCVRPFCPVKVAEAAVLSFLWGAGASPGPWTGWSACGAADDGLTTGGKGQNQLSVLAPFAWEQSLRCTQHWRLYLNCTAGQPKEDDSALPWDGEHPGPVLLLRTMGCPREVKVSKTFPSWKLLCERNPRMYSVSEVVSKSLL